MLNKVRGTQDFLNLALFNFIINTTRAYLECHHFSEIATPILEHTDLFKRSLGLHTDVVTKQMFTIATADEGESICLRPEATASTMRAFVENHILERPWKVFSWGPMFRYERPQKGRFRQFHQINLEMIDAASIQYDAYLIMLLDRLFSQTFLLENYALMINFLGCSADRQAFKKILDTFLASVVTHLCATCKERKEKNAMRVFDCKNEQCQEQYRKAPHMTDHLCSGCKQEWQTVQDSLQMLSVTFSHAPSLVRGLDYYNKTVFEFVSTDLGAQSAFCGGGRYDHLLTYMGGKKDYPAIGASIGVERLMLLLEPLQDKLPLPQHKSLHCILPLEPEQQTLALFLADELFAQGLCVDVFLDNDSLKSMMRKANKLGAQYVLIVGPDEQAKGEVVVKNMQTGAEERIKQTDVAAYLKK
ncbi:MAG: histidine--tRNA ligase [Candidatus Babeliales bacterium]